MRTFIKVLFLAVLLTSCKSESKNVSNITEQVKKTVNEAVEKLQKVTPQVQSLTTEELEKLFTFEYQITEISADTSTHELEAKLQQLGKARWECFHIERAGTQTRLYLKRRPESYLRYIPRWFP